MKISGAAELKAEFDRSFTSAPLADMAAMTSVLAVRIGGDAYLVALSAVRGLVSYETIVPVPTASRALLGLVGLRGALVPVFDLGVLLGYSRAPRPRWLLLVEREVTLALAFECLEAHVRLPAPLVAGGGVLQAAGASRRLIDVESLEISIRNHTHV